MEAVAGVGGVTSLQLGARNLQSSAHLLSGFMSRRFITGRTSSILHVGLLTSSEEGRPGVRRTVQALLTIQKLLKGKGFEAPKPVVEEKIPSPSAPSSSTRRAPPQKPLTGAQRTDDPNDREKDRAWRNAAVGLPRPVKRAVMVASSGDKREESLGKSRREWLLSSAALAVVAVPGNVYGHSSLYDVADDSAAGAATAEALVPSNGKVQSVEDVSTWYRYRGEGFTLRIPPGYQDILDPVDEEALNSLYGERAKDKPFAARFASLDRNEVLSVVIKPASQMKLSFFEAMDIKDFGTIKDAAPKFVPGGAKLVAARIINSTKSRIPRTYYMYEFLAKDKHVALSAGVASGRVFVMGATAPESKWKDAGDKLRLAASSFYLP